MRVSLSWHLPASVESPKVQEMYNSQINMTTQNLIPSEEIFCFLLLLPPPLVFLCKFRFLKVGTFKINAHLYGIDLWHICNHSCSTNQCLYILSRP